MVSHHLVPKAYMWIGIFFGENLWILSEKFNYIDLISVMRKILYHETGFIQPANDTSKLLSSI